MGEIATWGKLLQLLMAFFGSAGFAIMFHLRRNFLMIASFGGLLTWLVYLICAPVMPGYFFPSLAASAFGALYAEVLARWLKAPVHIILYCGDDPADSGKYIILQYELCSVRTTGTGKYLWLTDFSVRTWNWYRHEHCLGTV